MSNTTNTTTDAATITICRAYDAIEWAELYAQTGRRDRIEAAYELLVAAKVTVEAAGLGANHVTDEIRRSVRMVRETAYRNGHAREWCDALMHKVMIRAAIACGVVEPAA